ncbi:DUF2312 domain-containing protein (plasmid) [Azospirillum argentinense]|uniref:DUF2312 domain-containing protein n=1 Tax=Azospirillum argentinense TaxID=2970906 RepID=A0A4D8PMU3_9PROT|nr:DUF2312 domain-containing protein [Azospirillum argentinense]QCN99452.1 DUF2312 domain-containing protein [Azospirillum argentinense]
MSTPILPPLSAPTATEDRVHEEKLVTLACAHEEAPGIGHNMLSDEQRELLRSGIERVREIQRQIDALNEEKAAVYQALRKAEVEPALVRKVVYRLGLTAQEIDALVERDLRLAAYWAAVEDLRTPDEA